MPIYITATSSLLSEQPTVLLCKTPESIKQKVEEGTGMSHHIDINPTKSSSGMIFEVFIT